MGTSDTSDTKIFDKDTILDLTVNIIPLGIILFFIVYLLVFDPWTIGDDPLIMVVTLGLHVVPFVSLAILTYFSGKAIAGSEKEGEVYLAGRASVSSADPLETEHPGEPGESDSAIGEPDAAATAAAEDDPEAADEAAAESEGDTETGTPDQTGEEGSAGSETQIETGENPSAETRDASEGEGEDEER